MLQNLLVSFRYIFPFSSVPLFLSLHLCLNYVRGQCCLDAANQAATDLLIGYNYVSRGSWGTFGWLQGRQSNRHGGRRPRRKAKVRKNQPARC